MARGWPWRRRSEGFEWHKYVRTTIAVRREQRRERAEEIKRSAQDGAVRAAEEAARLSRMGAQAASEGARRASRASWRGMRQGALAASRGLRRGLAASARSAGQALGASGRGLAKASKLTAHGLRRGAIASARGLAQAGRRVAGGLGASSAWLGQNGFQGAAWTGGNLLSMGRQAGSRLASGAGPMLDFLGRPGVAGPLMLAGCVALLSGVARPLLTGSLDREAFLIMAIGGLCLLAALTPRLRYGHQGQGRALGRALAGARDQLRRVPPRVGQALAGGGAMIAAVLAVVWLWPAGLWPASASIGLPSMSLSSFVPFKAPEPIVGRARADTGETLRIGSQVLHLEGIEAPDMEQTCLRPDNRRWRCGQAARAALSRLISGRQVHCQPSGKADNGVLRATCTVGESDLAEALVAAGHVFATPGWSAPYSGAQARAQEAKRGLWSGRGEPERPAAWRSRVWDEASAKAPKGCPIKGKVAGRRGAAVKSYHAPWSPSYRRMRVVPARGDRWFCSEAEAQAAGFSPAGHRS